VKLMIWLDVMIRITWIDGMPMRDGFFHASFSPCHPRAAACVGRRPRLVWFVGKSRPQIFTPDKVGFFSSRTA
jgi:hypothetical protein